MDIGHKLNSEADAVLVGNSKVKVDGGCTAGLFPSIKKWFEESEAHSLAFAAVVGEETLNTYQSMIDCVVGEVFKDLRPWFHKHYRGEGPVLSDLVSRKDAIRIESVILQGLAYAIILDQARRQSVKLPRGWRTFAEEARKQVFGD